MREGGLRHGGFISQSLGGAQTISFEKGEKKTLCEGVSSKVEKIDAGNF